MWYNRLKIGKDDVGSIVEPRLSLRHHLFEPTSSLQILKRLYLTIYETLSFLCSSKAVKNYIYAKIQAEICMFT